MSRLHTISAAVALVASLGLLTLGIPGVLGARADEALRSVKGTVVEVSAKRQALLVRGNSPNAPTHENLVRVVYRYAIDGQSYTGDVYAFDEPLESLTDDAEAAARVEALRADPSVTVFVDPADPARAALARRELGPPLAVGAVGLLGLLVSGALLIRSWLTLRAERHFARLASGGQPD